MGGSNQSSTSIDTTNISHLKDIKDLNTDFLFKLIRTLSMDDHFYTVIPSLTFLVSSLIVVYFLTHKRSFIRGHSWKQIAIRELVFQWGYYYVTRLWIGFMKILRCADAYCQQFFGQRISHDIEWVVHLAFFLIYTSISLFPVLLIMNEKLNRPVMPNFMVWVGAHRWERTEMGMSGYYLDRPLRYVPMRTSIAYRSILPAYRTRRSCSADHAVFLQQIQTIQQQSSYQFLGEELDEVDNLIRAHHNGRVGLRLRYVRSMEHVTPISNIDDLTQ